MKLFTRLKHAPYVRHLTDKYVITLIAFITWVTFFSSNSLLSQHKLRKQLREHKLEREYYIREIDINKRNIRLLDNDLEHLEKIARERYMMKRDNEEIFIFVEE